MNNFPKMVIENREIGFEYPTFFIADIAANHDGDLKRAVELIWKAKEAGADVAKFQHFSADTIVSDFGFKNLNINKSHQELWGKSVYEVYQDASINIDWNFTLKKECEKAGIIFMTSPYSFDLVDKVDEFVTAYKIGSGDITWIELVKYIAKKNKPYILATGASTINDVKRAYDSCYPINKNIALLQCNTNYTGSIENMKFLHLNVLKKYQTLFPGIVTGLSDHTPGHTSVLGAISLGARIIEKHFTDDCSRNGPDHAFSMNPKTWKEMVIASRELEAALGHNVKKIEDNEFETSVLQRRSLRAKGNLKKGDVVKIEMIDILRPCPIDALPPYKLDEILGKKLKKNINHGDYFKINDVN